MCSAAQAEYCIVSACAWERILHDTILTTWSTVQLECSIEQCTQVVFVMRFLQQSL